MAKKLFTTSYLSDIANSIRNKLGVSTNYKISQMSSAIDSIVIKQQPQLYTPTISVSGDTLTINPSQMNGSFNNGSTFTIYIDGEPYNVGTDLVYDLYELAGHPTAGLRNVVVVQHKDLFVDSDASPSQDWGSNKNGLRITAINGTLTIKLQVKKQFVSTAELSVAPNIYYKKGEDGNWLQMFNAKSGESLEVSLNQNEYVVFSNKVSSLGNNEQAYICFNIDGTGNAVATGNLMSMLNNSSSLPEYAFEFLFNGCSKLTTLHNDSLSRDNYLELPITNLSKGCYINLFASSGVVELINTLPAVVMKENCYYGMFANCTSLSTIKNLDFLKNITTLAKGCMAYMFSGCTSQSVLIFLPQNAYILAEDCYAHMFEYTAIATIHMLDLIRKLAKGCFKSMYCGCTRLNLSSYAILLGGDIPESAYEDMFRDCTSITKLPTISSITSIGIDGMKNMFYGCSGLNVGTESQEGTTLSITLPSELSTDATKNMFLYANTYHETGWVDGTPLAGQTIYYKS